MKTNKLLGRNFIIFDVEDFKILKILIENGKNFPFPFNVPNQAVSIPFLLEVTKLSNPSLVNHLKKLRDLLLIKSERGKYPYHTSKYISITFEGERMFDILKKPLLGQSENELSLSWADKKLTLIKKESIEEILKKLKDKNEIKQNN